MARLNDSARLVARSSLVVLWLASALVSVIEITGRSAGMMAETALPAPWHHPVVIGGAALDLLVGIAVWRWHRPAVYWLAGVHMMAMTMAVTWLLPQLWLDPLASLTKNLPVAALLWVLYQDARTCTPTSP